MSKSMARRRRKHRRPIAQVRVVGRIRGGAVLASAPRPASSSSSGTRAHGGNISLTARHFGY